jgi:hypothetical protein
MFNAAPSNSTNFHPGGDWVMDTDATTHVTNRILPRLILLQTLILAVLLLAMGRLCLSTLLAPQLSHPAPSSLIMSLFLLPSLNLLFLFASFLVTTPVPLSLALMAFL